MDNVVGDLFAGEAKLFFAHPRRQWRQPLRVETLATMTATDSASNTSTAVSFTVHIENSDFIMLCDSRMNPKRVAKELCASDIGCDTNIALCDVENAGRWTSVHMTLDGRHWSNGEYQCKKRITDAKHMSSEMDGVSALSCLVSQLPPLVIEAVHDGRAIILSVTKNIASYLMPSTKRSAGRKEYARKITVRRVCKSFGNLVYKLCVTSPPEKDTNDETFNNSDNGETIALLIAGRFWPKNIENTRQPLLTVARKKSIKSATSPGGGVFCICLGDYLQRLVNNSDVEEIAKSKRHYEGYFDDTECNSFLKTP